MPLPISSSEELFGSSSFERLAPGIQQWIWQEGWNELKDAQEQAIPVILAKDRDVIIAAATASGKTEAAFLPILTDLLAREPMGVVLYLSPLKALINDQWGRLQRLCDQLKVPVTPWHGDISSTQKKRFFKAPKGVVLITPESLEALLMNWGHALGALLQRLDYVVLDEAHAFIGSERGKQVQSQLARLEALLQRRLVRIGLSATLGEMRLAAEFLRPGHGEQVAVLQSQESSNGIQVLLRGYLKPAAPLVPVAAEPEEAEWPGESQLIDDVFRATRGGHHLVFPNRRREVERLTDALNQRCQASGAPPEYWPHHGSLARALREETEAALKNRNQPATGVCTTTLELGIDIGDVRSISQVGAPPSVASLRQRLGRSGRRRGVPSILYGYCVETERTSDADLVTELREGLLENIAMVELLARRWYEPPRLGSLHLSTLVQQLLSLIGQYQGLAVQQAWDLLRGSGVFVGISKGEFVVLLKHLAAKGILTQDSSGLLLHGEVGERMVNHFSFYAAFADQEEYRLVCEHKALGTLPMERPVAAGSLLVFGGRRWRVLQVDSERKVIEVQSSGVGKAPFFAGSGGFRRHAQIRATMRAVLHGAKVPAYLDETAVELLQEARARYRHWNLDLVRLVSTGDKLCWFGWLGDEVMDTLALLLRAQGLTAQSRGLYLEVCEISQARLHEVLREVVAAPPEVASLAASVPNRQLEKWDPWLPPELLNKNYASHCLDLPGALAFIEDFLARG